MLVSAKEMLIKAKKEGYAIGHFNTNNLEWTRLILEVAEEQKSPVIIAASEGATRYIGGYKVVANLIKTLHEELKITVPVAIHLDHGSYDGAVAAIKAGFTSVMYDGSALPFDENLKRTREIVDLAHKKGCSVEAEIGAIGGEEDGVSADGELADPNQAKLISKVGIDFLAAGIGNIHGVYPSDWKGLNFDRLKEIEKSAGGIPIVLHGGTGIPKAQIKKAISLGVAKINVNTELQLAFAKATRKYIEDGKDKIKKGFDPRKLLKPGVEAAKDVVREKMKMFGSVKKAK